MKPTQVIRVRCPNLSCRRILSVPTDARGAVLRCRSCGVPLRVPGDNGGGAERKLKAGS